MFLALWQNVNSDGNKTGEISYFGPYKTEQSARDAVTAYCLKDRLVSEAEFRFEPLSMPL